MGPIKNGRYSCIDSAQGADEVPGIGVFRAVHGREDVQDKRQIAHVTFQRIINANIAQNPFPHVPMCVDEARHNDHVGGIDDFSVAYRQVRSNSSDLRPLDEDIAPPKVAKLLINGDDTAILEQSPIGCHEVTPLSSNKLFSIPMGRNKSLPRVWTFPPSLCVI